MQKTILALVLLALFVFAFSMTALAAQLPSAPEMESRLLQVLDEPGTRSKYYPLLLKHAGQTLTPQDVVDMFDQETEAFLANFSKEEAQLIRVQLVSRIIPMIRSLLRDYPKEADEAVRIHLATQKPPQSLKKEK